MYGNQSRGVKLNGIIGALISVVAIPYSAIDILLYCDGNISIGSF